MRPSHVVSAVLAALLSASALAADPDFTVVLLPDTQKYSESYPQIFLSQTQWVVDNVAARNIVFVSQLGDIIENGSYGPNFNALEWDRANTALSMLDGVVPWGAVIGNHDFDFWNAPLLMSTNFASRFGPPRFTNQPWFGGWSPDGYSSYQYFVGGGRRFLILHLIPDIPPAAMAWAQGVINAHPGVPTLITTHIYMKSNGRTLFPYMDLYDANWNGHSGEEIFQLLIKPNPQVFMMNCGHVAAERFQITPNILGQPVYEALQDYQLRELGGNGLLRILRFSPAENKVYATTYSTWYQAYEVDADSQFEFSLDFDARLGPAAGDTNCDGVIDFADIDPFVLALSDPAAYSGQYPNCRAFAADCNFDGAITFEDIDSFVARLAAP